MFGITIYFCFPQVFSVFKDIKPTSLSFHDTVVFIYHGSKVGGAFNKFVHLILSCTKVNSQAYCKNISPKTGKVSFKKTILFVV